MLRAYRNRQGGRVGLCKVLGSGLGGILCLFSGSLYAVPTSTAESHYFHPHHFYFDLGVGKTYDYARSNSFLEGGGLDDSLRLRTGASYSTPFFLLDSAIVGHKILHGCLALM